MNLEWSQPNYSDELVLYNLMLRLVWTLNGPHINYNQHERGSHIESIERY